MGKPMSRRRILRKPWRRRRRRRMGKPRRKKEKEKKKRVFPRKSRKKKEKRQTKNKKRKAKRLHPRWWTLKRGRTFLWEHNVGNLTEMVIMRRVKKSGMQDV